MKYLRRPGITDIPECVDAIQLIHGVYLRKIFNEKEGYPGDYLVDYKGNQTIKKMNDFQKQYRKAD